MIRAKGANGELKFDGDVVTVEKSRMLRETLTDNYMQGVKTVRVEDLTSVSFQPVRFGLQGYIQLCVAGVTPPRDHREMMRDLNTVFFEKRHQPEFELLEQALNRALKDQAGRKAPLATSSPLDELKKLKDLLDSGVLSQVEFEAMKNKLMDRM
jgi:hypothetical protein